MTGLPIGAVTPRALSAGSLPPLSTDSAPLHSLPAIAGSSVSPMPRVSERRVALQGQGVRLQPISAAQNPVRTRISHRTTPTKRG